MYIIIIMLLHIHWHSGELQVLAPVRAFEQQSNKTTTNRLLVCHRGDDDATKRHFTLIATGSGIAGVPVTRTPSGQAVFYY
jgi:hypothetical protein